MNTRQGRGRAKAKEGTPNKDNLTASNDAKKTLLTPCRRLGLGKRRAVQNSPLLNKTPVEITSTPVLTPAEEIQDVPSTSQLPSSVTSSPEEKPKSSTSRRKKSSHPLKRTLSDSTSEGNSTYAVLLSSIVKKRKIELVDVSHNDDLQKSSNSDIKINVSNIKNGATQNQNNIKRNICPQNEVKCDLTTNVGLKNKNNTKLIVSIPFQNKQKLINKNSETPDVKVGENNIKSKKNTKKIKGEIDKMCKTEFEMQTYTPIPEMQPEDDTSTQKINTTDKKNVDIEFCTITTKPVKKRKLKTETKMNYNIDIMEDVESLIPCSKIDKYRKTIAYNAEQTLALNKNCNQTFIHENKTNNSKDISLNIIQQIVSDFDDDYDDDFQENTHRTPNNMIVKNKMIVAQKISNKPNSNQIKCETAESSLKKTKRKLSKIDKNSEPEHENLAAKNLSKNDLSSIYEYKSEDSNDTMPLTLRSKNKVKNKRRAIIPLSCEQNDNNSPLTKINENQIKKEDNIKIVEREKNKSCLTTEKLNEANEADLKELDKNNKNKKENRPSNKSDRCFTNSLNKINEAIKSNDENTKKLKKEQSESKQTKRKQNTTFVEKIENNNAVKIIQKDMLLSEENVKQNVRMLEESIMPEINEGVVIQEQNKKPNTRKQTALKNTQNNLLNKKIDHTKMSEEREENLKQDEEINSNKRKGNKKNTVISDKMSLENVAIEKSNRPENLLNEDIIKEDNVNPVETHINITEQSNEKINIIASEKTIFLDNENIQKKEGSLKQKKEIKHSNKEISCFKVHHEENDNKNEDSNKSEEEKLHVKEQEILKESSQNAEIKEENNKMLSSEKLKSVVNKLIENELKTVRPENDCSNDSIGKISLLDVHSEYKGDVPTYTAEDSEISSHYSTPIYSPIEETVRLAEDKELWIQHSEEMKLSHFETKEATSFMEIVTLTEERIERNEACEFNNQTTDDINISPKKLNVENVLIDEIKSKEKEMELYNIVKSTQEIIKESSKDRTVCEEKKKFSEENVSVSEDNRSNEVQIKFKNDDTSTHVIIEDTGKDKKVLNEDKKKLTKQNRSMVADIENTQEEMKIYDTSIKLDDENDKKIIKGLKMESELVESKQNVEVDIVMQSVKSEKLSVKDSINISSLSNRRLRSKDRDKHNLNTKFSNKKTLLKNKLDNSKETISQTISPYHHVNTVDSILKNQPKVILNVHEIDEYIKQLEIKRRLKADEKIYRVKKDENKLENRIKNTTAAIKISNLPKIKDDFVTIRKIESLEDFLPKNVTKRKARRIKNVDTSQCTNEPAFQENKLIISHVEGGLTEEEFETFFSPKFEKLGKKPEKLPSREESVFFTPPSSRSENDSDSNRNDFQIESELSPMSSDSNPYGEGTSKRLSLKGLSVSNLTEIIGFPPTRKSNEFVNEVKISEEDKEVEDFSMKSPRKTPTRGKQKRKSRVSNVSRKSNVSYETINFGSDSDDDFQPKRVVTQPQLLITKDGTSNFKSLVRKSTDVLGKTEHFRISDTSAIIALHRGQCTAYVKSKDISTKTDDNQQPEQVTNEQKSMILEQHLYKSNKRISSIFDSVIDDPDTYLKNQETPPPRISTQPTRTEVLRQITDIEKRIREKRAKLDRLKLISVYKRTHDLDILHNTTQQIKKGCQEALLELAAVLRQRSFKTFDMATLLENMSISHTVVGYNEELDEFT